jgi:hypothetical protein
MQTWEKAHDQSSNREDKKQAQNGGLKALKGVEERHRNKTVRYEKYLSTYL